RSWRMYPASARRPKDGGSRLHSRLHLAQRTTDDRTAEHQTLDRRRDDLYGTGLRKHSSSGLSLLAAVKRSFKRKLDQRNEPVKWRRQSDVLHLLLQKNKTVFHREAPFQRSEEHTSELQSPYDLVCRLLLEKKK